MKFAILGLLRDVLGLLMVGCGDWSQCQTSGRRPPLHHRRSDHAQHRFHGLQALLQPQQRWSARRWAGDGQLVRHLAHAGVLLADRAKELGEVTRLVSAESSAMGSRR